jgi:hypothetical protein
MNGEPRETSANAADYATPAKIPPATIDREDQPLPEAINTEGVSRTTVVKEDVALAPLFTQHATTDFRSRWDVIQRGFVDDPEKAVRAGDDLVAQVIKSLSDSFSEQRAELEGEANQTEKSSTESRRLAFRRYRSFFERLLSI